MTILLLSFLLVLVSFLALIVVCIKILNSYELEGEVNRPIKERTSQQFDNDCDLFFEWGNNNTPTE